MARSRSDFLPLLPRRNARLDSFLKRNTERALYERIRTYEPCVVVSDVINKVYMYAVLSDERVYLTEFPPRALTAAVSLERVRDIELVNDLPDFLSSKDRERCQHIRITYIPERPAEKQHDWLQREKGEGLPPVAPPSRRASHCPIRIHDLKGSNKFVFMTYGYSRKQVDLNGRVRGHGVLFGPNSAWCPSWRFQVTRRIGAVLTRLLRRDRADFGEEREAELHLYVVSQTSTLYLHLQSCWNSFVIKSTRLLDPVYRRRSTPSSDSISAERTAHLFAQLSSELLQDGITVENRYLLLQELRTAAHRNVTLRRLFWRSGEAFVFLVQTLEECLHGCQSFSRVHTTDQLLLSTLIIQTFAVMFRETEVEVSRSSLLFAKRGALISRLLLAFVCDPDGEKQSRGSASESELQGLVSEYLDAACSLLFELLPHRSPAQLLVLVLSDQTVSVLSPVESVLLFQRCHLLLACLQYNNQLAQHLQLNFREEFRFAVTPSSAEQKLQPRYPICKPTVRLVQRIVTLIQRS
uniref:Chromosome 17 C12orf56 homolog n=1 Tax=Xiphophorus maculatus TaxID=8083 RepID=A0A3B5QDJ0_XIPMA